MPEMSRNNMIGQVATNLGRVSINPRGKYDESATYTRLDLVSYEGSSFLALTNELTGITPKDGEKWMLIAKKGDTGANGKDGDGSGDMLAGVYDTQGKHTDIFQYVDNAVKNTTQIIFRNITIPAEGWKSGDSGVSIDVAVEGVTDLMIPIVFLDWEAKQTAKDCGLRNKPNTIAGAIQFFADKEPEAEMSAELTLLIPSGGTIWGGSSGGGTGGSDYTLPVATKTQLGGVKIGKNVNVTSDGLISVDDVSVSDDMIATEEEIQKALDNIYNT